MHCDEVKTIETLLFPRDSKKKFIMTRKSFKVQTIQTLFPKDSKKVYHKKIILVKAIQTLLFPKDSEKKVYHENNKRSKNCSDFATS